MFQLQILVSKLEGLGFGYYCQRTLTLQEVANNVSPEYIIEKNLVLAVRRFAVCIFSNYFYIKFIIIFTVFICIILMIMFKHDMYIFNNTTKI